MTRGVRKRGEPSYSPLMGTKPVSPVRVLLVVAAIGLAGWSGYRLLAAESPPPDFDAMATPELVRWIAECGDPVSRDADELYLTASLSLHDRDRRATCRELVDLVRAPESDLRAPAVRHLGSLLHGPHGAEGSEFAASERATFEQVIDDALADVDFAVRLEAWAVLAETWWLEVPPSVPDAVGPILSEALASADERVRAKAYWAARGTGPAIAGQLPELIAALDRETPEGPLFMLLIAIASVGRDSPEAVLAIIRFVDIDLDDEREGDEPGVRYFAMTALHSLRDVPSAQLQSLFPFLDLPPDDPLHGNALGVLAKYATEPADVERALHAHLGNARLFPEHEAQHWLAAVGRLGARTAGDSKAAALAVQTLEDALTNVEDDVQPLVQSALLQLGAGRGVTALVERYRGPVALWLDERLEAGVGWNRSMDGESVVPAIEAFVSLIEAGERDPGIDAGLLRRTLEQWQSHALWWQREWASEQLGRVR